MRRRQGDLLLETKLYAPRPPRGSVDRPRLSDRLRAGIDTPVTLVSAPAGFGKTTLLADLVASSSRPVAWVSLDRGDNDPGQLWGHVLTALDRAIPGVGVRALELLADARGPQGAAAALINDLGAADRDVVLVLDDVHALETPEVYEGLVFLVEHLPPTLHLVLGTRADPPLPLARLRGQGRLTEIRAADLRFTSDETAAYLAGPMALTLSPAQVGALDARTEGWIAAIQLAGLSMQRRDDVAGFIEGFAGDDRFVVDYLAEEVLQRQTPEVRTFLLRTSILARMTGSLCDAVVGGDGGSEQLRALDRANLFLVALDDQRRWYRYHHLFADVLRARLLDQHPDDVPDLHRRAATWFEASGDRDEAIRHALAGGAWELAADLIELATPDLQRTRREAQLRRWFDALPREVFTSRPVLGIGYVGAIMSDGSTDGIEPHLVRAERWLAAGSPETGVTIVDPAQARRLPGLIRMYRAAGALGGGDLTAAADHARAALDAALPDDFLVRGGSTTLLALASWTVGDLDAAYAAYEAGMASLERADFLADVVGGAVSLADIRLVQGRLGDAGALYERGLAMATAGGGPPLRGAADMHVGLADVRLQRGDLDGATRHLAESRRLGDDNGLPKYPWRWRLMAAAIREDEGDLDGALALVEAAAPVYDTDYSPDVRPIRAVQARLWVARGDLAAARAWAAERGLSPADDLSYLREFEHLVLAELLLADGSPDAVRAGTGLAERLLAAADGGGRGGSAIRIGVVLALLRAAEGDEAGALSALEAAVIRAEPERDVRSFTGRGAAMTALLHALVRDGRAVAAVRRILDRPATPALPVRPVPTSSTLVEPLSKRELEVLALLQSDLDGPGMAGQLFVSVNTLRTHTKRVYAKLGVTNRRAAVRRAIELGLLRP